MGSRVRLLCSRVRLQPPANAPRPVPAACGHRSWSLPAASAPPMSRRGWRHSRRVLRFFILFYSVISILLFLVFASFFLQGVSHSLNHSPSIAASIDTVSPHLASVVRAKTLEVLQLVGQITVALRSDREVMCI